MNYLQWVSAHTPSCWWHDSADEHELAVGLNDGAVGVTTNPVLIAAAADNSPIDDFSRDGQAEDASTRAERVMQHIVVRHNPLLLDVFESSSGANGYICAQVNPRHVNDCERMVEQARRYHQWAPNVAVKLPATAAGLVAMRACVVDGITVTLTLSYSVAQCIAVAEHYEHARETMRLSNSSITPGRCFAVLMVGRLDDSLREAGDTTAASLAESDIRQAGLAVAKRVCEIYQAQRYSAKLMVAALRGPHHLDGLVGNDIVFSIHPKIQAMVREAEPERCLRGAEPIAPDVINRLRQLPEFEQAYEPDGLYPDEFLNFSVTQKTLRQFIEQGWSKLEQY